MIRDARRTDRRLIEEGLRQLSTRSRFVQYLGANLRLSKGDLDQLTDTDNHDDVAIGAVARNRPGGRSVPLGVARFIRPVPGGRAAEIAITVVDTYQGKGCGTALLAALARKADACGVEAFFALVHPENAAMRALAERAGGTVSTSGTETEYRINVSRVINEMKPASET